MRLPLVPRLSDFAERRDAREFMDDPEADIERLLRTIMQFSLVNSLLGGTARRFARHFFPLMGEDREYRVVDVGSGGCDIAVAIAKAARRRGIRLSILAIDRDARILPLARQNAAAFPEIEARVGEVVDLASLGPYDVVICNHLLHHLRREEIGDFLSEGAKSARLGLLFDDLLRSPWSWLGFTLFASVFTRGSFTLDDGRLSILRGFRPEELEALAVERGLGAELRVFEAFPGRVGFLLVRRVSF